MSFSIHSKAYLEYLVLEKTKASIAPKNEKNHAQKQFIMQKPYNFSKEKVPYLGED